MTDPILGWTSTMTDTAELSAVHRGTPLPDCETAWIFPPAMRPDPAPSPAKRASRVGRAARRAYAGLVGIGFAAIAALAVDPGALVELASIGH